MKTQCIDKEISNSYEEVNNIKASDSSSDVLDANKVQYISRGISKGKGKLLFFCDCRIRVHIISICPHVILEIVMINKNMKIREKSMSMKRKDVSYYKRIMDMHMVRKKWNSYS